MSDTQHATATFPVSAQHGRPPEWWGMALFIATEAALFAFLLSAYFYLRNSAAAWPPEGIERPHLPLPAINTVILLSSSVPMYWAERSIRRGNDLALGIGLALSFLLGALFLYIQFVEYDMQAFTFATNAYSSVFVTITGFHAAHVAVGLGVNAYAQVRTWSGHFNERNWIAVQNTALYWHFVDVVWIAIFFSLYLSPYLW